MAVKVLIKRKFKIEDLKKASQLLFKTRYGAMNQTGYISSETLSNLDDPSKVVVVAMWQSSEDWKNWKNSAERAELEAEMSTLQDGPTEFETYALGMQLEN